MGTSTFFRYTSRISSELPSIWLSPSMATLEHLALYNNLPFGIYPRLDLSTIHFPRLQSLALGNYTYRHDIQISWILSHGPTLRELYLDNCKILYALLCAEEKDKECLHPSVVSEKWEAVEHENGDRAVSYNYAGDGINTLVCSPHILRT